MPQDITENNNVPMAMAISNGEIKTDDADEIDAWVQNKIS